MDKIKELKGSYSSFSCNLLLRNDPHQTSVTRYVTLTGHTSRALHLASSPDGSLVCSCAADETLRFWNVFAPERKNKHFSSTTTPLFPSFSSQLHCTSTLFNLSLTFICPSDKKKNENSLGSNPGLSKSGSLRIR